VHLETFDQAFYNYNISKIQLISPKINLHKKSFKSNLNLSILRNELGIATTSMYYALD